jgi:NADPH-dependent curcumin reductase CurA
MGRDETVLVTAAAGAAGHIAVQLAKRAGNRVIGICGSPKRAGVARELGCDRAINHRDETVRDVLEDEYPRGIDLILDSVGGGLFDTCVEHLAPRGRIVVLGFAADCEPEPETPKQPRIYHRLFWKSASLRGCAIPPHFAEAVPEHRERLLALLDAGEIRALVDQSSFVGVESIPDAVEHCALGKACGKVVVSLAEP